MALPVGHQIRCNTRYWEFLIQTPLFQYQCTLCDSCVLPLFSSPKCDAFLFTDSTQKWEPEIKPFVSSHKILPKAKAHVVTILTSVGISV